MPNGTSGIKTIDQSAFKTQTTTTPKPQPTAPSPYFQPQQYTAMQRLISEYEKNPQNFTEAQKQQVEKLKLQSDIGYRQAVETAYTKSPETLRPELKSAFETVSPPVVKEQKVETDLPENMGLPKPTDMAAKQRIITSSSYLSPVAPKPLNVAELQSTKFTALPTATTGAATSPVASVNVERRVIGGNEFIYLSPISSSGKPVEFPSAKTAGIPQLKGDQGIFIKLPTQSEKETAFSEAINKGYMDLQKKVAETPNSIMPTKAEFAAAVTPDLEQQWQSNINAYMKSSELSDFARTQLSEKFRVQESNLKLLQSKEYQMQQQIKYLKESGKAERILKTDTGLQYLVSSAGDFTQLGGTLTGQTPSELKEAQITKAATILAAERTFKQKPELERAGLSLINIGTLGLSQSVLPEDYRLSPTSTVREYYASQAPTTVLGQAGTMGFVGGELFTLAPAYITGAARGIGITSTSPVLTAAGKYTLTAGQIGKAAQIGVPVVLAGYTGLKTLELETQTIPTAEKEGATKSEIAGIRTQWYGSLGAAAAGGILGAAEAKSFLQEEVTKPRLVGQKATYKETGKLGEVDTTLTGQKSYLYYPARTRGQVIAKEPPSPPISIDVKTIAKPIGQEVEGDILTQTILSEAKTYPSKLKYSEKRLGGGEQLVTRRTDIETAKMVSLTEEAAKVETEAGTQATYYTYSLGRGGTKGSALEYGEILQFPKTTVTKGGVKFTVEPSLIKNIGLSKSGGITTEYITPIKYMKITELPSEEVTPVSVAPKTSSINIGKGTSAETIQIISPKPSLETATTTVSKFLNVEQTSLKTVSQLAKSYDKVYGTAGYTSEFGFGGAAAGGLKNIATTGAVGTLRTVALSKKLTAEQPLRFQAKELLGVSERITTPAIKIATKQPIQTFIEPTQELSTGTSAELRLNVSPKTALKVETGIVETGKYKLTTWAFTGLEPQISKPPPMIPLMSTNFPFGQGRDLRGMKGEGRGFRKRTGLAKEKKKGVVTGILSEGLSRQMFGRATLPKGATEKGRAIFSSTAELEKAGINVGSFLESGGYVAYKNKMSPSKKILSKGKSPKSNFTKTILGTKFKRLI